MSFAQIKTLTETLRFRLAVWNATVVVLTAVVTLLAVREGVRLALVNEMDRILQEDAIEIELAIPKRGSPTSKALLDDLNRKAEAHKLDDWFVRFMDAHNEQVFATEGAPGQAPPMPKLKDYTPFTRSNFRIVQSQLTLDDDQSVLIQVGSSLKPIDDDVAHVDRNVLIVSGFVLLVAPLCGYWLAGRATRPLAAIIHTTSRLRPAKLDERLPIRGTGDELDQLSSTFNRLLDRIAAYLDQKRDFLANAAHELRSPLAAIRSTVEVALSSRKGVDEYEEILAAMIEECAALEVLVNQLLLLAETEADSLKIYGERVRLDEVVQRSVGMFEGVADFKGIALRADVCGEVQVEGNRQHLRQVLNNLIDNAIKFTPATGLIVVSLTRDEARSSVILRVTDSGQGISAEDLPHVFDRFFRSDRSRPREGETRGTGLGLSICEAVVKSHGGQISVNSTPGKGTTFTVTLPLAPVLPAGSEEMNGNPPDGSRSESRGE